MQVVQVSPTAGDIRSSVALTLSYRVEPLTERRRFFHGLCDQRPKSRRCLGVEMTLSVCRVAFNKSVRTTTSFGRVGFYSRFDLPLLGAN